VRGEGKPHRNLISYSFVHCQHILHRTLLSRVFQFKAQSKLIDLKAKTAALQSTFADESGTGLTLFLCLIPILER